MKKEFLLSSFILVCLLLGQILEAASSSQTSSIAWITDYEQAVKLGKQTSKPLFLFFTGSDWCGWCNKLEKEVLEAQDFVQAISDKLIFVKLDYPMRVQLDPETTNQNERLQEKFSVKSFPTIVILNFDQQPIGMAGYRTGGGKQYAQHVLKMVNDYSAYKQQMQRLGVYHFSGKDLKRLYQKARELGLEADSNLLIRKGMSSDQANFFLTERYRHLVHAGQMRDKETLLLKRKLLDSDPGNEYLTHYQVAIIDFEAYSDEAQKNSSSADMVVEPLLIYIEKHGHNDRENLWRLNMIISQVYLDHNRFTDALRYAQDSYSAAPSIIQPEISSAIKNIQSQIKIKAD
jgi:protein disulfide-isomerase